MLFTDDPIADFQSALKASGTAMTALNSIERKLMFHAEVCSYRTESSK